MAKKSDDPRQIAFLPEAPAPERYDAQVELHKAHRPLASELIPPEDIREVINFIEDSYAEAEMAKARTGTIIPFPDRGGRRKGKKGMQSVYLDDLQIFAQGEYWEKPAPVGYSAMRTMVDQTPMLAAILLTRQRQAQLFCRPQEKRGGLGFEIRHRDRDREPEGSEVETMNDLTRFFNNCGWEWDPRRRKRLKRSNFSEFMIKAIRDTLTMDALAIETEFKRDRTQGLDGFYAIDGATIRLCDEDGYEGDDELWAVQVVDGMIRTAYSYDQLVYTPRNPRTDVMLAGYGTAETELLIRVVTGFLNAMTLNIKGFTDNSIPRGILHLSGEYAERDLNAFKRYWNGMVKGINNAWAMPVMVSPDQESKASFEPINTEFNEMYFSKWMTFLTSLACAIYSMSPDEINFESFSAAKSALSGSDTAEKLADSKDKGLRPMLGYFESLFSDYMCLTFGDKYLFRFTGLDEEDAEKDHELLKLSSTVNEVRALRGQEPLDGILGDAPVNPSLIGLYQQENAPEPEPGADGFGGEEGGDGQEEMDFGRPDDEGEDGEEADDDEPGAGGDGDDQPDFGKKPAPEGDFGKSMPVITEL